MPHLTARLTSAGCELDVWVGASQERQQALVAAGQPIPASLQTKMIIDTGATGSVLDEAVIKQLGLTPTGTTQILTPSSKGIPSICPTFDVQITIYHRQYALVHQTFPVISSDLRGQNIQRLLGCDFLQHCLLIFDGMRGEFTLAF
jgi:predicted aspartyl protease